LSLAILPVPKYPIIIYFGIIPIFQNKVLVISVPFKYNGTQVKKVFL
jgi:hypothetical protein